MSVDSLSLIFQMLNGFVTTDEIKKKNKLTLGRTGRPGKITNTGDKKWEKEISSYGSLKCHLFFYRTWKG